MRNANLIQFEKQTYFNLIHFNLSQNVRYDLVIWEQNTNEKV